MKNIFFTILLFLSFIVNAQTQWQNNIFINGKHFQDINTVQLQDGSEDYIIAGTLFNDSFTTEELTLIRIENLTGTIVWQKTYSGVVASRGFDIIRYQDNTEMIAVTGYVSSGGTNHTYIATINALNGNVSQSNLYDFNGLNSQGLHIIYTQANFNGTTTKGFVVGGFYNVNYNTNTNDNSKGFVLRVDEVLTTLWINDINVPTSSNVDYDMVNHINETNNGYFITGSITQNNGTQIKQNILALKIDFNGNFIWNKSYNYGNARDVGVDSYYDSLTDEIYLLVNYSINHYFGVTVFNNTTGIYNNAKSWYTNGTSSFNIYAFKINASQTTTNNLVIYGYERQHNFINNDGVPTNSDTILFALEFVKNTGAIIADPTSYLVPHTTSVNNTNYFKFWDWQMPLILYSDIAVTSINSSNYFNLAYRTINSSTTAIEMNQTFTNLRNLCLNEPFELETHSITYTSESFNYSPININENTFNLMSNNVSLEEYNCEGIEVANTIDSTIDSINIYPNPVKNILHLTLSNIDIKSYSIFDIQSRLVKKSMFNSQNIDVTNLNKGVYILKLEDINNKKHTVKFIKQ